MTLEGKPVYSDPSRYICPLWLFKVYLSTRAGHSSVNEQRMEVLVNELQKWLFLKALMERISHLLKKKIS